MCRWPKYMQVAQNDVQVAKIYIQVAQNDVKVIQNEVIVAKTTCKWHKSMC